VKIVRRSREISRSIAELREEEAKNAQNPYAAMARMYEAQQLLEEARSSSSKPGKRQKARAGNNGDATDDGQPR